MKKLQETGSGANVKREMGKLVKLQSRISSNTFSRGIELFVEHRQNSKTCRYQKTSKTFSTDFTNSLANE